MNTTPWEVTAARSSVDAMRRFHYQNILPGSESAIEILCQPPNPFAGY
jgi:hypothetical protein